VTLLTAEPPVEEASAAEYAPAVRLLGGTLAAVVLVAIAAACSNGDDPAARATLPPIQTTSTVPTTIAATTTQPRFYKIQPGDTLGKIAAAYGLPIQAIMEKNNIADANKIYAGQILELPLASEVVVTSLPPVTTTPGPTALPAITNPGP
jgi:LysM repeat protein